MILAHGLNGCRPSLLVLAAKEVEINTSTDGAVCQCLRSQKPLLAMSIAGVYTVRSGVATLVVSTLLVEGMDTIDISIYRVTVLYASIIGPEGLSEVLPQMEIMDVLSYYKCQLGY